MRFLFFNLAVIAALGFLFFRNDPQLAAFLDRPSAPAEAATETPAPDLLEQATAAKAKLEKAVLELQAELADVRSNQNTDRLVQADKQPDAKQTAIDPTLPPLEEVAVASSEVQLPPQAEEGGALGAPKPAEKSLQQARLERIRALSEKMILKSVQPK